MNDTPKRWLIEYQHRLYVMNGYGDALAAVRAWADDFELDGNSVRVSEVLPGHDVNVKVRVEAEYR